MGRHTIPANRLTGGLLLGAAASGALALASLSGAGSANADCVSVSGVSAGSSAGGSNCTSGPGSFAIGIGNGTTSTADDTGNGAIAIGNNSQALVNELPAGDPRAGDGSGNLALAIGSGAPGFAAAAVTRGSDNLAVAIGSPANNPNLPLMVFGQNLGQANAGNPPTHRTYAEASGTFNNSFSLGDGSITLANGGNRVGPPTSIGNNTAIGLGAGAVVYAGANPPTANQTTPNNQFALAGPGKLAVNTINP